MSDAAGGRDAAFDLDALADLIRTDPGAAAEALHHAARRGDVEAEVLYAQMLCEARGVAQDAAGALHWFTLAANSGHAGAMNMVGRCHELGHGTRVDATIAA